MLQNVFVHNAQNFPDHNSESDLESRSWSDYYDN